MESKKKKREFNPGFHQENYWDQAGQEAKGRVGNQTQIKGTIHEIAIRDRKNLSPKAIFSGERTALTKSRHATTIDLVTTKNGKVVERIQAKDVISRRGVSKVVEQAKNGKYRNAKLIGTEETKILYNQSKIRPGKPMSSSGVSSKTTTRAADNTGIKIRGKDLIKSNFDDIAIQSKNSAIISGAFSAAGEVYGSYSEFKEGKIDEIQYAGRIAKTAAISGGTAAVKTYGALALKEGAKVVTKKIGSETLKRVVGSNAITAVAFGVVDQAIDTFSYASGRINGNEYGGKTVQNVTSTGGAIGGAWAGAALGSIVPLVGTTAGAVVGGIVGAIGGSSVGSWIKGIFS